MEWHISTPAGRKGPVDVNVMKRLAADGLIDADTLVWRPGMAGWIPASSCCELSATFEQTLPPPISEQSMGNGFIWALALLPIWGTFLQMMATELRVAISGEAFVAYAQMWWVVVLANIVVITLDVGRLKKTGYATKKLKWWMYLLVPVYVFQRDKLVQAGMTRFWIWIGAFLVSLVLFKF
jgi:hypothetical protein